MTDAQLMEEELQHSVMMSEGDIHEEAHFEVDEDIAMSNDGNLATNSQADTGGGSDDGEEEESDADGDEEDLSRDEDEDDEDAEGEDDDAFEEEEDDEEEDEGEEDLDAAAQRNVPRVEDRDAEGEDDEDEGVGAVKIKPGETDDEEDDEESEDDASSASDAESAAWEEAPENDEEEESDNAQTTTCMFCKEDEENDPGEDFEAFLTCAGCGEHAGTKTWNCPDCAGDSGDDEGVERDEHVDAEDIEDAGVNAILDAGSPPATRRATAPKLARDLLPSQKGTIKPDSHSVFNQLVLDEDPMDGSRILRKRKTSSAEADEDIASLRKRRRNTDDDDDKEDSNSTEDTTRPHSARSLRPKISFPRANVEKKTRSSLVIKFRVSATELRQITSQKPRGPKRVSQRGPGRPPKTDRDRARELSATMTAPFVTSSYTQPFYSFFDKETDESKGKPYGGILTEAEADTSKTMPTNDDRRRFDEAKQQAEEEWRQRLLTMQADIELPVKKSRKASGPASQIECIEFGGWEIDTWYAAPYPEEYSRNRVLYICEFCLKYMNSDYVAWRHKLKCPAKHPPGDEIYRYGSVSVFEVDGRKNPVYCQNLCLLAKLFLGSKTLYYDVEPFLFYVLCEYDDLGYHFVGYFSKEKRHSSQNNVSCILTLPIHQRKGYGNLLIDFSYLLTRVEEKTGSPEKPLSDMGLVSYRNYWRLVMCQYMLRHVAEDKTEKIGLSIKQISEDTGLTPDDVISALEGLRCLVRDPQTQLYAFRVDLQYCREYVAKWESKNYVQLNPKALTWTPYVMGRTNATNFELGPALNAIAPREDDEEHKTAVVAGENLTGETSQSQPVTNGVDNEPKEEPGTTVLESTEPNETGDVAEPSEAILNKPNGVWTNGDSVDKENQDNQPDPAEDEDKKEEDWKEQYLNIPATRFEVFPPINKRAERPRAAPIARPPPVRTVSAPRPKPRRPSGSRRPTAPKPKTGSKRKTGGTGRGPGRWPKGTKKSDYGNADSGPGFPPGWLEKKASTTGGPVAQNSGGEDNDTVQVSTPKVKETKGQKAGEGSARRNGTGTPKGKPSPRPQDTVMTDA
ncbi:hypothetical protein GQ53DRAFT_661321 [Thozetella sp. PMI_491]|nr:hypothetical protein GQ53DRAFT_661321 [Thozetella sp. PMI_491]